MAYLPEENVYETGIYQLELTDKVMGGVYGTSNLQGKQLANRTKYLKSETERLEAEKIDISTKGQANGVASLDSNGRVPYSQLPEGVPVGCVLPYFGSTLPSDNWLWCDGDEFDETDYPLLYTILGESNTTPNLTNKTLMGGGTLGASSDGALPNITGSTVDNVYTGTNSTPKGSGALNIPSTSVSRNYSSTDTGNRWGPLTFDASRSNGIYKNNQTYVEPANIRCNFIIRGK